ncbi:MAG TPA: hypothetical protein VMJ72_02800 [Candidatus Paceibacterota bacterium]|nr:hypothetical protein [Candidatus Paceibacterota bacterium]
MRIKVWVLTGAMTIAATAALGVIIAANDPVTAEPSIRLLFWAALSLAVWGVFTTVMVAVGSDVAAATWTGLMTAAGTMGCLVLWRSGHRDTRLLGGVILATLLISLFVWRRIRHAG